MASGPEDEPKALVCGADTALVLHALSAFSCDCGSSPLVCQTWIDPGRTHRGALFSLLMPPHGSKRSFLESVDLEPDPKETFSLIQRPVQMDVPPIDYHMLARGVPGLGGREEKHHGCRYLGVHRHAMSERNPGRDLAQAALRIARRIQQPAIERSHHLGRNHGVYPDPVRSQLSRPFARQRKLRSFAGGVGR